jgi:5-methylcytosine-specific restriction endonuclease McrBC regulatory subunit McrC
MFFDMNKVWERYIFCELRRHAAQLGVRVDRQVSASFWAGRTVRPDIVVYLDGGRQVVIDTKWKELQRPEPADGDLYQMFIYNHQVKAVHSILLYPDIHGLEGKGARFKAPEGLADHGCSVDFARVWREQEGAIVLNREVGRAVWGMVRQVIAANE